MRVYILHPILMTVLCMATPVLAADQGAAAVTPEEVVQPVAGSDTEDRLGLGATGYGSPVLSDRISPGEIFDGRTGYAHPFLSIGGFHTDNLFRTSDDEESDWVAVITPGVWFSLPASQQKLLEINLLNTAPGGLAVDRFRIEAEQRLQGYALYRADIREHDRFKDENRVDHRGEGLFKISLRGGLSLELLDVYEVNSDPYGTGGSTDRKLDEYAANLFSAILAYEVSPKLMLRVDYGNYGLDYDAARNDYRDRSDNTYSVYVFYQATPKTAMFVQGEYITVDYDKNINDDNERQNCYLGIEMKATAKTRALFKVGYGEIDYDHDSNFDREDLLAEGQVDYAFTPKTTIYLRGSHRVLETDQIGARNILSTRVQFGYRQRIMAKIRAEAAVFYLLNEYDGSSTIGTKTAEREDDEYGGVIALGYSPINWGTVTLGYEYRERESNFESEDFRDNTVFLRMTVAI